MPRSYLCIGGPLHGQVKEINHDFGSCLTVAHAPDWSKWVGTEQLSPPHSVGPRESHYNIKRVSISESRRETNPTAQITVTVDLRADVELLVHESVLTLEEAAAYFRKLRPGSIAEGALLALGHIKLARR